ncbi:flavodoxin [Lactiplantibacillus plantarum]|uniref:flavodoxin n=1 Tax=Lactiplantibacillus plantarum TaxID=1590 RepID=UPI0028635AF0|nr:flavodoxin [Lactiplantibacillus plantarum]MDR7701608.1 flavodoxin [Lactiplantibacillus plantarum]
MVLKKRMDVKSASAVMDNQISDQPVVAYQLGKTASIWRHGAGTKSDGMDTNASNQPTRRLTKQARSIIIYFSRSGSTELLASQIAKETQADILEIVVKSPYSRNYQQTLARANSERETANYPELNMQVPDLSQYQTIYLGYPIWAMTLSHPMTAFLIQYGSLLQYKRIAPFMTEGGYGQGDSVERLKGMLKVDGSSTNQYEIALVIDGNKVDREVKQINQWIHRVTQRD